VPQICGSWAAPLVPGFVCPFTGASSADGDDLSEEWANGNTTFPETHEQSEVETLLLEPEGIESESGSDSSDSESEDEKETPPHEELACLFLTNLNSGCFHALVPCEVEAKGAVSVEISGDTVF